MYSSPSINTHVLEGETEWDALLHTAWLLSRQIFRREKVGKVMSLHFTRLGIAMTAEGVQQEPIRLRGTVGSEAYCCNEAPTDLGYAIRQAD
jgi:hypothetical protein